MEVVKSGPKYATYKCNDGRYQVTVDGAECGSIQKGYRLLQVQTTASAATAYRCTSIQKRTNGVVSKLQIF